MDSVANKFFSYGLFIQGKDTLPYRYYLPVNQNFNKTYQPVSTVIFLHGAGERGNNNQSQLMHMGNWLMQGAISNNLAVFIPQCSADSYWSNVKRNAQKKGLRRFEFQLGGAPTEAMELLMAFTDSISREMWFDSQRCYIGGLSMGGMGTAEICKRKPGFFKAAFPICGGGLMPNAAKQSSTRWWVFHGNKDNVVSIKHSKTLVKQLKNAGVDVKFTTYPGIGHNAWDPFKLETDFWPWLLQAKP